MALWIGVLKHSLHFIKIFYMSIFYETRSFYIDMLVLTLCRPGWLQTHRDPSASKVLQLKACVCTTPGATEFSLGPFGLKAGAFCLARSCGKDGSPPRSTLLIITTSLGYLATDYTLQLPLTVGWIHVTSSSQCNVREVRGICEPKCLGGQ